MTVAGNPGVLILVLLYFFLIQMLLALLGGFLKQRRFEILYYNTLIGMWPNSFLLKSLYEKFVKFGVSENDYWIIYISSCGVLNFLFFILNNINKNKNILIFRWSFFVWVSVFGSFIFTFITIR
ncbi:hypothetical protein [Acinetobacter rudis]|uniref:Uncharacterized protein n=1 Tax=Acinetobacter rudis CIP 110305 TaxID=421052 RepID=S3MVS0_9GAMM|nr:hypothetical protein [Acinetobacter rudis]EPF71597.1 hypothetical protein F945_02630 [Acinetobacter rudis CIP 110305]